MRYRIDSNMRIVTHTLLMFKNTLLECNVKSLPLFIVLVLLILLIMNHIITYAIIHSREFFIHKFYFYKSTITWVQIIIYIQDSNHIPREVSNNKKYKYIYIYIYILLLILLLILVWY